MFFIKLLIILVACYSLLFSFCSATPVPQFGNIIRPYSNPSCHEGYSFSNGMCAPINCPPSHILQNGACVLSGINVAQQAQCTTSCCQANCQPPCQQPCPVQMPMQMPVPVPVQMQIPVPMPFPIYPPFQPPPIPPPFLPLIPPPFPPPIPPSFPPPIPPPIPPSTQQPPTTEKPPDTHQPPTPEQPPTTTQCGNGTIFLNGYCHLVYCGTGVYRDGKCIMTICPEGTIWNGQRCTNSEPHNHTTVLLSTVVITNDVNQTQANHSINYTNDIVINITESPLEVNQVPFSPKIVVLPPAPPRVHIIPAPQPPPPPPPPRPHITFVPAPQPPPPPPSPQIMFIPAPQPSLPLPQPQGVYIQAPPLSPPIPQAVAPSCCTITTPNACLWEDRYVCRSQSYQQCGSICSQGNLHLMPRIVRQPPESCINSDCGYNQQPFYPDCSRCATGEMMTGSYCQTYCKNKSCESCKTFDLTKYCESYPGTIACRPEYGYTENSDDDFYD